MSEKHNSNSFSETMFGENESRRKILKSIKAKADAKRTKMEKLADSITAHFGSNTFLSINVLLFIVWILINTDHLKFVSPFDPFPFNLLTMIVSLEAIILSIFVLISQNRNTKIEDLREEIHLQLNLISEREITKLIKMTALLLQKEGIDLSEDPELKKMIRPISEEELQKSLEREILR